MNNESVDQVANGSYAGTLALTGAVQQLVTDEVGRLAKRVRLIAPVTDAGVAINTEVVRFGNSGGVGQLLDYVTPTGKEYFHIDDARKIFVKGKSGENINYRIEFGPRD